MKSIPLYHFFLPCLLLPPLPVTFLFIPASAKLVLISLNLSFLHFHHFYLSLHFCWTSANIIFWVVIVLVEFVTLFSLLLAPDSEPPPILAILLTSTACYWLPELSDWGGSWLSSIPLLSLLERLNLHQVPRGSVGDPTPALPLSPLTMWLTSCNVLNFLYFNIIIIKNSP